MAGKRKQKGNAGRRRGYICNHGWQHGGGGQEQADTFHGQDAASAVLLVGGGACRSDARGVVLVNLLSFQGGHDSDVSISGRIGAVWRV